MTFHREGTATLGLVLLLGLGLNGALYFWTPTWVLFLGLLTHAVIVGLIVNFFRMPKREIPSIEEHEILCPSDGEVVVIERVHEPEWFQDERIQISVFMSPLNVHAQWAPMTGKVLAARYHPGKYLVAWHPKSSTENERTTHVIEGSKGTVMFRQIAGAVARRICWYIKDGDGVNAGDEVGFIKFGSRIDVFLPLDSEVCVDLNEKVTGRQTVLARLPK